MNVGKTKKTIERTTSVTSLRSAPPLATFGGNFFSGEEEFFLPRGYLATTSRLRDNGQRRDLWHVRQTAFSVLNIVCTGLSVLRDASAPAQYTNVFPT